MKMADCPTSVRHRIRNDDDDGTEIADTTRKRIHTPRINRIEQYLRQHGHGHHVEIAAEFNADERVIAKGLRLLCRQGLAHAVGMVELRPEDGLTKRRRSVPVYKLLP